MICSTRHNTTIRGRRSHHIRWQE